MRIATIGSGNIGGTLGTLWVKAGHQVIFSSRHPQELAKLAARAGRQACIGSYEEAADFGEVILLAIPLYGLTETFPRIRQHVNGKIVIDAMNFFENRDGSLKEEIERYNGLSTSLVASKLPEARIVKAFNCIRYAKLQSEAHREGTPLAIPFAGEDSAAKRRVAELIQEAGFEPYDLGGLEAVRPVQPGGVFFTSTPTAEELRAALG